MRERTSLLEGTFEIRSGAEEGTEIQTGKATPGAAPVNEERTRVVLADGHTMFHEVVAEMLSTDDGIEIVGEANDGVEAVAWFGRRNPT
jgi:hypothetical protein